MTTVTTRVAEGFLVGLAERLTSNHDPALIRAVLERASGGQLSGRRPDGGRASTLTISGIPFEASVTGGSGKFASAIRYVTEPATQEIEFGPRVTAQIAAIRDLAALLPTGDERLADVFRTFVLTLYPQPARIPAQQRFATWIGVVHHAAAPHHVAGLKVYGNLRAEPGVWQRLCRESPGFEALSPLPAQEKLIGPAGAAIETDVHGDLKRKVYFRTRPHNVAVPMKLVRHFGDPAWELLSELVSCGVDAATLHRYDLTVCCARGTFALHLVAREGDDFTDLARALASRHHGSTHAVDALARAAEASGANWHYSAIGLGFSTDHGIDKLNVYAALS